KYYKAPERAGISYMLSPILRTYTNPDVDENVITADLPHVMFYAPNVSNEAVGGALPKPEEFRHLMEHGQWENTPDGFVIMQGPHGYMVHFWRSDGTRGYHERIRRDAGETVKDQE